MRYACMLALSFLLLPLACRAVPTGLNAMPTANTLGLGETRVDWETVGSGKLFVPANSTLYGTEFGLVLGLEGGADRVPGKATLYNVKWRLRDEGLLFPALAAGAQNIASGEKVQYYAVATKSLLPAQLVQVSAGVMRVEGNTTLAMVGASGKLGPIMLKADRINGGTLKRTGVGASIDIQGLMVTGTIYDLDNAPNERTIMLSYTRKLF